MEANVNLTVCRRHFSSSSQEYYDKCVLLDLLYPAPQSHYNKLFHIITRNWVADFRESDYARFRLERLDVHNLLQVVCCFCRYAK